MVAAVSLKFAFLRVLRVLCGGMPFTSAAPALAGKLRPAGTEPVRGVPRLSAAAGAQDGGASP